MAFMDFLPQFGDNTDQSIDDPNLASINLKRKLALADSLRNTKMPQGQMVGDRYVAPSWTQYLAGAVDKGMAGYQEDKAFKEYGAAQKAQQEKLGKAVELFGKEIGPEEIKTMKDNFVTQPLQMGANVSTSPFKTNDQVAQAYPNFTGQTPIQNMTGDTTVNQPIESTTYRPRTQAEKMQAVTNFGQRTNNPDLMNKIVLGQAENIFKTPESLINKIDVDKYDPKSIQEFIANGSKDYSLLKPIIKSDRTTLSNVGKLTSELNDIIAANPNDPRIPQYRNAIQKETTYKDESNKPPAGYAWGKPDANGIPTLVPYKGGPGDKAANPTKEQSDAYTFSTRMENADKTLNELEGKYNPLAISAKTSPITANIPGAQSLINSRMSPETQKAEQAQRDFVNAVLRRESGSAISQSEFDNARIQYFPQPGDSPQVLEQKRNNRQSAIQGLKRAAGSMNNQSQNKVVDFNSLPQ